MSRAVACLLAFIGLLLAPTAAAAPARLPFDAEGDPLYLVGARVHVGDGTVIEGGVIEVRGTRIAAVGAAGSVAVREGMKTVDLSGAIVTPGFIAAATGIGLTEIGAEESTNDGGRQVEDPIRSGYDVATAINAESTLLPVQAIEGVTSAAVTPAGGLLSGQVAWIDLLAGDHRSIVARPRIAMQANLGRVWAGSRAATLAKLREVLDDARFYRDHRGAYDRRESRDLAAHRLDLDALVPVLDREIPLVVSAHRASDLLALVQLAKASKLRIVIAGGAQAWKVADALAEAKIPVIVQPTSNLPGSFDQIGARLDNAALLHARGVEVGIALLGDMHNLRNLGQEAGIAVANGLPREVALSAVTRNIARAHGMDAHYGTLAAGKVANVVVWDGDPFELSSVPKRVYVRGREVPLTSRQTELRERYRDLSRYGSRP
jgi:imidazolonepropionase-like amidohydrolase